MTLKKLTLTTKPFADLIDENYLYADKTEYIYKLLSSPKSEFFLSRPRKFGKTLLLHTLNELFTGSRKRFEGLWINESDYDFPAHPVIFLSLSIDSDTKKIFRRSLMTKLEEIADANNLRVRGDAPNAYFSGLIKALHAKYNAKVVVLIDEYDAPVSMNRKQPQLAQANAEILSAFYAALKDPGVAPYLHFTFVAGITRWVLNSDYSGLNHLNDITLDPAYAGICGFLSSEFDSLFGDRMQLALASLKKAGTLPPSADIEQLREKIDFWYGGYDWGGESKILNPYSILNFFHKLSFGAYWIQSGRPGHLTAAIKSRPLDFLTAALEPYALERLRNSDLIHQWLIPVIFLSGYLTLDTINAAPEQDLTIDEKKYYSFKPPNHEVQSSYISECLSLIFGRKATDDLQAKRNQLLKAFLAKDSETVSFIFSWFFSSIYYRRPNDEKSFHLLVHMILLTMGFKCKSRLTVLPYHYGLCIELPKSPYLIVEFKHRHVVEMLRRKEMERILADLAKKRLMPQEIDESLANLAITTLKYKDVHSTSTLRKGPKRTRLLADLALKLLSESAVNQALAATARLKLPEDEIDQALPNASYYQSVSYKPVSDEKIDSILSTDAEMMYIFYKNYPGMSEKDHKECFNLVLTFYGCSERIKAFFDQRMVYYLKR
jgi:hypothetical protein